MDGVKGRKRGDPESAGTIASAGRRKEGQKKKGKPDWTELESTLLADGLTIQDLYAMTQQEVYLRYYGILKKQVTQARQMRDISYTIYCSVQPSDKRVEIWEYHPLAGDPTAKQRKKSQEVQAKKDALKLKKQTANAMDIFRKKGLIN